MKFLSGPLSAAGLGLLLAPATGEQTREHLEQKAGALAEMPRNKAVQLAEASKAKAGERGNQRGRKAAEKAVDSMTESRREKKKTA